LYRQERYVSVLLKLKTALIPPLLSFQDRQRLIRIFSFNYFENCFLKDRSDVGANRSLVIDNRTSRYWHDGPVMSLKVTRVPAVRTRSLVSLLYQQHDTKAGQGALVNESSPAKSPLGTVRCFAPLFFIPASVQRCNLKQRVVKGCSECSRLWNEVSEATFAHFSAQSRLQIARFGHAVAQDTPISREADLTRQRCVEGKSALRQHECLMF
jgi:hypothetical protein